MKKFNQAEDFGKKIAPEHIMKHYTQSITSILIACIMVSCSQSKELPTVESVDLNRYAGKWFEIARLPQAFEKHCACVTAEYEVLDYQRVGVTNACLDTTTNEIKKSEGKAFPVDGSKNTKLKVQFFFPFKGDYYVIALDEDYEYAMVGAPNRSYLWILSRTPVLDENTMIQLKAKATELGFDLKDLIITKQNCVVDG